MYGYDNTWFPFICIIHSFQARRPVRSDKLFGAKPGKNKSRGRPRKILLEEVRGAAMNGGGS